MSRDELPPLPDTEYGLCFFDEGGMHESSGQGYTAAQMRAYAAAAVQAELRRLDSLNSELLEALRVILNNNESLIGDQFARAAIAKAEAKQ